MNQTDVFRFPFIGCREDGEPFEYMLLDIDQEKATIAIYRWMVSHFNLDLNEKIYLFIPSVLTLIYQFRKNTPGIVSLVKKDEQEDAFFYEISFNQDVSSNPNIKNIQELALSLPGEGSISEMLIQLVKDSIILKQGIRVYLKHLAPYFSRIVDYSLEDYQMIKNIIFEDIKNKVIFNENALKKLYASLCDNEDSQNIPILLNLEDLRENIESEISMDLFLIAFTNSQNQTELMSFLKESNYQDKISPRFLHMNYLMSIKDLEKRLYSNYNQIVLLYIKCI